MQWSQVATWEQSKIEGAAIHTAAIQNALIQNAAVLNTAQHNAAARNALKRSRVKRSAVRRGSLFVCRLLLMAWLFLAASPWAHGQAQTVGQWSTLSYTMPINPVHAALLRTGNVLIVSGSGNVSGNKTYTAALWNRQAGTITVQTVPFDMFCNGMVILPDGRPFVLGGTEAYDPFYGLPNTATYDPATGLFTNQQSMAHGRWYATGTMLGNGSVMLYPRLHLLPNGTVFYSAPTPSSAIFDPSSHTWSLDVANTVFGGNRGYGTSVLLPLTPANNYDPQVMIFGGGNPATKTTEIIDLGASTPAWQNSAQMSQARIEMNAVLLPSGKVLALGGSVNDEDTTTASLQVDLFDPALQTFTSAGGEAYPRLYHSVSLLLPDATVWVTGGNPTRGTYEQHMEIYQPAYLFQSNGTLAVRPTITSAPAAIDYGTPFQVQTPDAANISSVVMMRNGAVTHSFDMDQRMVGLAFTAGSGTLSVTGPPNGNIAPPGYYMLFLLNTQGVPSVASMVQVPSNVPPPPPPGITYVQGKSTTQSSGTSVAIPFSSAQNASDLNVVEVMWGDTTATVSSVTDSKGNTYALAAGPTKATGLTSALYYAKNIAAGTNTVTVKFSATAHSPNVNVLEYSGLDTTNPLDVMASATGSGTTANSGSATTTSANDLIVGAGNPSTVFSAAGAGFSSRMINAFGGISEDKIVSSTGSYNATATMSSGTWVMQMAAFRGVGQGTTPPPSPTVTSIAPVSGSTAGGTAVAISGTGFLVGATVSLGGTAATGVTVVSSTSITATTPAHAAGAADVVVTNSGGQSGTLAGGFTYTASNPAPTVSSILPTSGPTAGGTAVTIAGTGFLAGATVSLGGTAATGVTVVSSTSITATSPAHAAGAVNVVVTNTDAQSGTLTGGYSYNASTGGTIAFVQSKSTTQTSGTSVAIVYPAAQVLGDLNVVEVMWGDTTATVSSVTDTKGNTYVLAAGPTKATGLTSAVYYAKNIAAGANTVTVKFNVSAAFPNVNVLEYSGLDTANPLDVTASATGSGTTANSGSATTTSANDLIIGAGNPTTIFTAAGAGFTKRLINAYGGISEDEIVTSTGSYNATAAMQSGTWVMQMVAFRASGQ